MYCATKPILCVSQSIFNFTFCVWFSAYYSIFISLDLIWSSKIVNCSSSPLTPTSILRSNLFSSPEKSFQLHVYVIACISCLKFKEMFFLLCSARQQTLTTRGAHFFNYRTLRFCTIIMHIMLEVGSCVPNLRGRRCVKHTQIHPPLKRGTKKFHYTSNCCGIFGEFAFP